MDQFIEWYYISQQAQMIFILYVWRVEMKITR